jgi:hypothetical protein
MRASKERCIVVMGCSAVSLWCIRVICLWKAIVWCGDSKFLSNTKAFEQL